MCVVVRRYAKCLLPLRLLLEATKTLVLWKYLIFHEINYLKQQNGVYHCKELVETIKIDILFAIFGAPNKKILISQIKNEC
jgi:hypothetical protein